MNKITVALIAVVAVVLAALAILIGLKQVVAQQSSAISLNLGTLYPNDTAIIQVSKEITVSKGGNYAFTLTNYQGVEKDFSYFIMKISFSNSTTKRTIYLEWYARSQTKAYLFLSPGKYNLTLYLVYSVNKSIAPFSFSNIVVKMNSSPLISVDFAIQTQPTTFLNLAFAKPICINLGELNGGLEGPFSNSSTLVIPAGGEYLFEILHVTELEKEFKEFGVLIILSNSTEKIEIPVGFSYSSPSVFIYSNPAYLSPGVYKMNVSIYYQLNRSVKPISFKGTAVELGYTPLVNVNFAVSSSSSPQPTVTQVGTGVIYSNGTAIITLKSTGSVEIEEAVIEGTSYTASMNSITPYKLYAGINTVYINFGPISIQPESIYTIALYLSDGAVVQVAVVAQ